MHEAALANAALPAPTVIQGIPLLPFSLGHELCLIRESNAFACGGTPLRQDLLKAIWVCSNTWDENKTAANQWLGPIKTKLLCRRFKHCNLPLCIESFRNYREAGLQTFPLSKLPRPSESGTARIAGAPFLLRLHAFVMAHLHLSESLAWDYPAGLAAMRWSTHWEQEGGLDIANEHEAAHFAYVERREREKREKAGKK